MNTATLDSVFRGSPPPLYFSSLTVPNPNARPNATSYWSGTFNGNGDNKVALDGNSMCNNSYHAESRSFFQHLALARLIPGTYNNSVTLGSGYPKLKLNSSKGIGAATNMDNSLVGLSSSYAYQLSDDKVKRQYAAALQFNIGKGCLAAEDGSYNDRIGTMTPLQAFTIDSKIDNGVASTGRYMSYRPWGSLIGNCLTGNNGDYLVTNQEISCFSAYILKP